MKAKIVEVKLVAASVPFKEACNMDVPEGQGAWLYRFMPDAPTHKYLPTIQVVDGYVINNYVRPSYENDQPDTIHYCGYPEEGVAFTVAHSDAVALAGTQ